MRLGKCAVRSRLLGSHKANSHSLNKTQLVGPFGDHWFNQYHFSHQIKNLNRIFVYLLFIKFSSQICVCELNKGIQPNVPAHNMCRHGLFNSMVLACTSTC